MNLKQLFNKEYFVQNILKSKAILALVTGIVPIFNAIFLLLITSSADNSVICDMNLISALNIIGMYVLPVIISICLLGYVFKRKSTDFINSMPLTKKQIFITNTIGGIVIILVMMLLNTLVLCIESLLIDNLAITFQMLLDYFIVWTISYIFVFTVSNIAVSLSGNCITAIIVTALILFFVPFMHLYLTGFSGYLGNFEPYYIATETPLDYENMRSIIKVESTPVYTLPFNYFASIFTGNYNTFSIVSIIKMLVLSVIYIAVGTFAFNKRKMEVNETSFKNTHIHMIVKSLTMVPIITFVLFVLSEVNIPFIIFFLAMLIVYSLVYDLITSKNIRKLRIGIVYFIATIVLCVGLYIGVKSIYNKESVTDLDLTKVNEVAINMENVINVNEEKYIYVKDEKFVNLIKEKLTTKDSGANMLNIRLKAGNKKYETRMYLNMQDYLDITKEYISLAEIEKVYKNINFNNLLAIKLGNVYVPKDKKQEIADIIKQEINLGKLYEENASFGYAYFKIYENNKVVEYSIPISVNEKLVQEYVTINNQKYVKDILKKGIKDVYDIYEYVDGSYNYLANSQLTSDKVDEVEKIVKSEIVKKVDTSKSIIEISGITYEYDRFNVYINASEEIKNILKFSESMVSVDE